MTPSDQTALIEYAQRLAIDAPTPPADTIARVARLIATAPKVVKDEQIAA